MTDPKPPRPKSVTLTVKSHSETHELDDEISAKAQWRDQTGRYTILFIHGFWTKEDGAVSSYYTLIDGLHGLDTNLAASVMTFSWPSRPKWFRKNINVFKHRDAVAHQAGTLLGKELARDIKARKAWPRNYVLVAHSLGGRVVMEALRYLEENNVDYGQRFRIILMATALPYEEFGPDGAETVYAQISRKLRDICVLYSQYDTVLSRWFRPGFHWKKGQAVGLHGRPRNRWADAKRMAPYKHDDYWADRGKRVSSYIADRLNVPNPRPIADALVAPADTLASPNVADPANLNDAPETRRGRRRWR